MTNKTRFLLSAGLSALMLGGAGYAQSADDDGVRELEAVTVTGIRGSLDRALAVKENADVIVDAISAEELGKFPDQNVAESLQRVTGVAITRSRGGEGQFVTVRGLGQEFNTLTYNGRELATENPGREFSFDVIPSELISAAQVFKTTTAAQTDGSIGGLVNIETARALSNPGFHIAASAATQLESLNDDFGFKGALVASQTFANDTIGVIGSISFQERNFRTDTAESIFIDESTDFNGDGTNDRLNSFNLNVNNEDRERLGATLAVEYEPNDSTSVTFDFLYTSFESPSLSTSIAYFPSPGVVSSSVVDANNDVVTQTTTFDPANPTSSVFDNVARRAETDTDTFQIGANWEQRFGSNLKTELDVSYSRADGVRDNIGSANGSGSFFVVSFRGLDFTQTANGGPVPDAEFAVRPTLTSAPITDLTQLATGDARLHFSRNTSNEIEDEVFTIRGDLDWEFSDNATFRTGFDFINREKTNELFDNSATQCGDTSIDIPSLGTNSFICDRSIGFADVLPAGQLANLFTVFNGSTEGFLSSTDANIQRDFLIPDIDVVEAAFLALGQLQGQRTNPDGSITTGTVAELSGVESFLDASLNALNSSVIEENVISAYFQGDWEGSVGSIPFTANAGVRFAYTDVSSAGAIAELASIVIDSASGNNTITPGDPTPVEVSSDYFDVLPSFNIAFDLQENLKLRGGFSRSIARPTFADLSPNFTVTSINLGQEAATGGNPNLEAVRSNNVDVSLEWYGDNGLSLSAAGFYKDIDDFIQNFNFDQTITIPESVDQASNAPLGPQDVTFQVSGPANSDAAEVYGIELAAQYILGSEFGALDGFGVASNITLADSSSTLGGVTARLENISDFSANVSVFYENHGVQGRVSLNHRSDFLAQTNGEGGFRNIVDDFTQIDLQLAYNLGQFVGHDFSVFVEGINITNEQFFVFSERETFLESFIDNGSRWLFGVRGSF